MICVKFVRKLLCARQKRKHNESPISYLLTPIFITKVR